MSTCNTTRNEKGGKDLLLKVCKEVEIDITATENNIQLADHGLEVGDLVRFPTLDTLDDVVAMQLYFVVEVPNDSNFRISATPGGSPITFDPGVTDLTIEVFTTLGGLRSKSFSFSADSIDVSNHGSNQWHELLDEAGMKSVEISGEGVYTSAANFRYCESQAFANLLTCFAFIETISGRIYAGCFKITSIESSGDYDGEATYSLSAASSGEVTVYQAA
jgi:TP901-1 family phage major tail protein